MRDVLGHIFSFVACVYPKTKCCGFEQVPSLFFCLSHPVYLLVNSCLFLLLVLTLPDLMHLFSSLYVCVQYMNVCISVEINRYYETDY